MKHKISRILLIFIILQPAIGINIIDNSEYNNFQSLFYDLLHYDVPGYKQLFNSSPDVYWKDNSGLFIKDCSASSLAIWGEGFFRVFDINSNKYLYTRRGDFIIGKDGYLYLDKQYRFDLDIHCDILYGFDIYIKNNFFILIEQNCDIKKEKIELYMPIDDNVVSSNNVFFEFKKVKKISDNNGVKIVNNALQLSNVNVVHLVSQVELLFEQFAIDKKLNPHEIKRIKRSLRLLVEQIQKVPKLEETYFSDNSSNIECYEYDYLNIKNLLRDININLKDGKQYIPNKD